MDHPIIVFDGVCNICSGWVQFVLKRDPEAQFHFAAMQDQSGTALLMEAGFNSDDPSTFILVEKGKTHAQTDAFIHILKQLKQPWPVIGNAVYLVSRLVRNWIYLRAARNRYRLFGKKDTCMIPPQAVRDRFF